MQVNLKDKKLVAFSGRTPMAKKRILLLLDGTWNDADSGSRDTNILRLRELIASSLDQHGAVDEGTTKLVRGRSFQHTEYLVFYERGVGTGPFLDRFRGGAFGQGLSANVRRAYKFLSFYYTPGDEIFIFGFSRGAYTARSLVGLIGAAGLLKAQSCTPELEEKVWEFYRHDPNDRSPGIWCELTSYVYPRESFHIQCVAVFDTVGALGVPIAFFWRENRARFEFHNVDLSSITKINLHALAIDEHREPFQATVWRKPKFKTFQTRTEQVWFPGAHADVGGGYIAQEMRQAKDTIVLDDIALDWMLKRLAAHFPDFPIKFDIWTNRCRLSVLAPQHQSRRNYYRLLPFSLRSIANIPVGARKWMFEREVSRDRLGLSIGESVHISCLERLGQKVKNGRFTSVYAPRNLLAVMDVISATYAIPSKKMAQADLRIVDWSGNNMDPNDPSSRGRVAELLLDAKKRLGSAQ